MLKTIRANYKQTFAYVIPALGLWIIFIVWMMIKSGNNTLDEQKIMGSKSSTFVVSDGDDAKAEGNHTTIFNSGQSGANIKIMTWNLQGLMRDELDKRTLSAVEVIEKQSPDVIFFQELVSSSYEQISTLLQRSYENVIGPKNSYSNYFTGIFYKKGMFKLESHKVTPFANSVMDRTMLVAKLKLINNKKIRLALLTSHLESLPRFRTERINQLKECFQACISFPKEYSVIFAGDLNLEENEEEGSVPDNIKDMWNEGGSQETTKYTWDSTTNMNEQVSETSQESRRKRLDRMYFRSSSPSTLKFDTFDLHGKELVEGTPYFPSDHWALMSSFTVV